MTDHEAASRDPFRVRLAVPEDLLGMARVHVETWKGAYRGLVPDERLGALTVENDIAGGFGSMLRAPPPGVAQFAAVAPTEQIIGFAMACPDRDGDPEFTGELGSIYVLPSWQGRGVGRALVGHAVRFLRSTGKHDLLVWVLEGNPYRRFYDRLGGVPVRRRVALSRIAGRALPEVGYGWKDTRALAEL